MDASFEPTFGGQWDNENANSTATQVQGSTSSFDRVPLPVQINDILDCQTDDDKIQLGGYSFGTLRVCGRILSKNEQAKETQLEVCDPSETDTSKCDRLTIIVYQSAAKAVSDYNEGDTIVALGKIRKFDDIVSFIAFGITVYGDQRLAETFKLEAKLAKIFYTANIPERIGQSVCEEFDATMFSNVPFVRGNAGNQANGPQTPGRQTANLNTNVSHGVKDSISYSDSNRGLTGTKQKIFEFVRKASADGESGVHKNDILRNVGPNTPNFQSDLQYLVNEGVLYNTIDDDHFAAI